MSKEVDFIIDIGDGDGKNILISVEKFENIIYIISSPELILTSDQAEIFSSAINKAVEVAKRNETNRG